MTLNTIIIRISAVMILLTGVLLYIAQYGLGGVTQVANASGTLQQTFASDSRGGGLGSGLPNVPTTSEVHLPNTADPIADAAQIVPASFSLPTDTPDTSFADAPELSEFGLPCGVSVSAEAQPAAIVALDVMAPCRAEAALVITHAGIDVAAQTDALGLLTLDIPGFQSPADFTVEFSDGIVESASVDLPDLTNYDRIGLVWQGDLGLELHAMEFGAAFGESGHIWRETPSSPEAALADNGGFLSMIQTDASTLEIYTLPRAILSEGDSVRLSIDAPVTQTNCAQPINARTIRSEGAGRADTMEIAMTMPGCDAVGDVLVLQNLLDDLRLAAN